MKKLLFICLVMAIAVFFSGCRSGGSQQNKPPAASQSPTFPTTAVSVTPSVSPTAVPSVLSSVTPSIIPTVIPSVVPSIEPSVEPSIMPTVIPTVEPSIIPSVVPSVIPSVLPTVTPSILPSVEPSVTPSVTPSVIPSVEPSVTPSVVPSVVPSVIPSVLPTVTPSIMPTVAPTVIPTAKPTVIPSPSVSVDPLAGVTFTGKTVTYNGEAHYIYVENLPAGYEVVYTNNGKTTVGTYTVRAQIRKVGSSIFIKMLSAPLVIEKAPELPPEEDTSLKEFEGIIFEDTTFPCDGTVHTLLAQNVPEFATVKYFTNTASKPAERKTARVIITAEGYKALTLTATITIGKGQVFVTAGDLSRTQYIVKQMHPTAEVSFAFQEETYTLQMGESLENCTGNLTFEYPYDTIIAGEYDITPAGLSSEMYDFVFVPGKFTVEEVKTNLTVGGAKANANGEMIYGGKPVHTVGVNYYTLFTSLVPAGGYGNPWTTVQASLATLKDYGVRVIRFNRGKYIHGDINYYFDKEETYYAALDKLLDEAARMDMLLIPAMFWNFTWMMKYYGESFNQAWTDENSKSVQLLNKITVETVQRYQNHPAILAWEFGNESNLDIDLPNWEEWTPAVGRIDTQIYADGIARWANLVAELDDYDRVIMTGDAMLRAGQYTTYLNKNSWGKDTYAQHLLALELLNGGAVNGVSGHIYGGYTDKLSPESVVLSGGYLKDREDLTWKEQFSLLISATAEVSARKGIPMAAYVGECGIKNGQAFLPGDTKEMRIERQRAVYDAIGQAALDTGMPVTLLWNYDPLITIQEKDYSELNPEGKELSELTEEEYYYFAQNGAGISEYSWHEGNGKGLSALSSLQAYNKRLEKKYGAF